MFINTLDGIMENGSCKDDKVKEGTKNTNRSDQKISQKNGSSIPVNGSVNCEWENIDFSNSLLSLVILSK